MRPVLLLLGIAMLLEVSACSSPPWTGTSPVMLSVASLEGGPGDDESVFRNVFASDVLTEGRVIEDGGRVQLALVLKDPGTADLPTRPSPVNFVTVTRYHVRYVRADGRAVPGVDVPHAFDGGMTFTVGPEGGIGRFVLVRAQSKLEPPLVTLRAAGGAVALSMLAEVSFYGRDQAGHEVSAVGLIGVNFADWADEE